MAEYDNYLKCVIQHLADRWQDPQVGIVASGIFDPRHLPVIATSERAGEGQWLHAERNALRQFENKFGAPSPGTIVVATLSPCLKPMSKSRVGPSCTELLVKCDLTRVHVGAIDTSHVSDGVREYNNYGIHLTISEDTYSKGICERLLSIFQIYGDRVNCDLHTIKEEIGHCIF